MAVTIGVCDLEAAERMKVEEKLLDRCPQCEVISPVDFEWKPKEIIKHCSDSDIIITALSSVSEEVIDGLENLSYIVKTGVGVDNIDVASATKNGVLVTRTPGVNAEGPAEHVIGMAIALNKDFIRAHNNLKAGRWDYRQQVTGRTHELLDETIGIIGFGIIGRRLAELARGFDMEILSTDPYVDETVMSDVDTKKVDLDQLLVESKYVSVNALLTSETRSMIGKPEFEKMREDAYLINTSRGPIVDEDALIEALYRGEISGAGIDVFQREPPDPNNPMFNQENIIVTPHIAGTTYEGYIRIGETAVEDVITFAGGKIPERDHIVNSDVLEHYQHPLRS